MVWVQMLYWPLRHLYLNGPSFSGYGFWEGLPREEICSRLTMVEARYWYGTPEQEHACSQLIERKVESLWVLCTFLLFAFCLFRLVDALLSGVRLLLVCLFKVLVSSLNDRSATYGKYCKTAAPATPQMEKAMEGST